MEEVKNVVEAKPTYEQLEAAVRNLQDYVRQINTSLGFKRLDYLFEILKNKDAFEEDIIKKCVEEVTIFMYGPEEETNGKE